MKRLLGICLLFVSMMSFGQEVSKADLSFFADAMVNSSDAANRARAGKEFGSLFDKWINQSGSFEQSLDDILWISIKSPSNASFRIITWQIKGPNNEFTHIGYVQNKKSVTKLIDAMPKDGDAVYEVGDASNWYGALYYGIEQVGDNYLLFGFNGGQGKEYTKLVDVLWFDKDGKAMFGKEVFRNDTDSPKPDMRTRILVMYDPTANVSCRYDTDTKMIIHDYTVDRLLGLEGNVSGKVPDGTYVAYEFEKDHWQRIAQLENTPVDLKAPNYNAKRDKSQSDILGRKKN